MLREKIKEKLGKKYFSKQCKRLEKFIMQYNIPIYAVKIHKTTDSKFLKRKGGRIGIKLGTERYGRVLVNIYAYTEVWNAKGVDNITTISN